MTPAHIVQLINHRERRGAELFAVRLTDALRVRTVEDAPASVQVVALAAGRSELVVDGCLLPGSSLSVPRCLKAAWLLTQRLLPLSRQQVVILQANAGRTLWVAVLAAWLLRLLGRRTAVIYRQASLASPWVRGRSLVEHVQGFFLRRCTAIASIATACAQDLLRIHPGLQTPIQVIPNIVPLSSAPVRPWHERSYNLLMVGAFTREKNHAMAFKAVGPLLQDHPSWRLALLGDGPEKSHWQDMVASQPWATQVAFLGNVSAHAVEQHMRDARALLLTSFIEGQPGVLVEAMGAGLPVIATAVGGVPELLSQGRGLLVTSDDADECRKALEQVMGGTLPDLAAARSYALATFTPATIADQFLHFYQGSVSC